MTRNEAQAIIDEYLAKTDLPDPAQYTHEDSSCFYFYSGNYGVGVVKENGYVAPLPQ